MKNMLAKRRKDHKLDEWDEFIDWIKTLPYHEFILEGVL